MTGTFWIRWPTRSSRWGRKARSPGTAATTPTTWTSARPHPPPPQEEKAEKKPAGKPARQKKLKFTFKEQREYDTIEADIAALEARIAQREGEMLACGSDYGKLQDLTKEQEADQAALEEKMERWLYLTDLAERIAAQEG